MPEKGSCPSGSVVRILPVQADAPERVDNNVLVKFLATSSERIWGIDTVSAKIHPRI